MLDFISPPMIVVRADYTASRRSSRSAFATRVPGGRLAFCAIHSESVGATAGNPAVRLARPRISRSAAPEAPLHRRGAWAFLHSKASCTALRVQPYWQYAQFMLQ